MLSCVHGTPSSKGSNYGLRHDLQILRIGGRLDFDRGIQVAQLRWPGEKRRLRRLSEAEQTGAAFDAKFAEYKAAIREIEKMQAEYQTADSETRTKAQRANHRPYRSGTDGGERNG